MDSLNQSPEFDFSLDLEEKGDSTSGDNNTSELNWGTGDALGPPVQLDTLALEDVSKARANHISIQQLTVARYIEQVFWQDGQIPTPEAIVSALKSEFEAGLKVYNEDHVVVETVTNSNVENAVKAVWKNERVHNLLQKKGVPFPPVATPLLSPQQLQLANMLLNLHDKRSVREKLKELGITSQQYHAWLRNPTFQNYLTKRGESLLGMHEHTAMKGLIQAIEARDLNAIKYFHELTGRYTPRLSIDVNVNMVLAQVVEVVARNVRDQDTLIKIADELDNVIEMATGRGQLNR